MPVMESIPFARADISPVAYLNEAWARVKGQYGLFLGITAVGALIGRALAERIPEKRARLLVLSLALAGGVTAVSKGLWGL